MIGKIASLPESIREPLNRRLLDNEPAAAILSWLNALSTVKRMLKAQFRSQPVSPQNLSGWKSHGFREWELCHHALKLAPASKSSHRNLDLQSDLSNNLFSWLELRFAAAAQSTDLASAAAGPELRCLHNLASGVLALRRRSLRSRCPGTFQSLPPSDQTQSRLIKVETKEPSRNDVIQSGPGVLAACPGPFGGAEPETRPILAPPCRKSERAAPPARPTTVPDVQFGPNTTGIFIDPGGGTGSGPVK